MASSWGSWVATDDWRCGVNAWISSQTDTTVTVTVQCIFDNVYLNSSSSSNGNVVRTSCNGSNSDENISLGKNYGHYRNAVVKTSAYTLNRGSGSAYNASFGAAVYVGASLYRAWSSASVTLTIPCRAYYTPRPPKDVALARGSDTGQKLTWTGDYTGMDGGYPWSGVYIDRQVDSGGWSRLATLSWNAINYTDASTSAGHRYDYAVYSYNSVGTSSHVNFSPGTFTTPTAYTGVTASKPDNGTAVKLTYDTAPAYIDSVVCQASTDNGATWTDCGIDQDTLTIASPPKGQVKFRLAAVKASGGTTSTDLTGVWAESNTVATLCAPNAPAITGLPAVVAVGTKVSVTWVPNHPDGTAQTKAQVKITKPDGTTSTTGITGSTTTSSFTASATGTYLVRVRTHGEYSEDDDDGWGAWCSDSVVNSAVAPVLSITSPAAGATVKLLPTMLAWTATDETGVVSQTVSVTSKTRSGWSKEVGSGDRSIELGTEVGFANDSDYTFTVSITCGSGLTASKSVDIFTSWQQPDNPDVTIAYDSACAAHITVTSADTGIKATEFAVSRIMPDGTRLVLGEGLESGHTLIDRLPPLNTAYTVEITSIAESGARLVTTYPTACETGGMCLNFGAGATLCDVLACNGSESKSISHDVETMHMFDGSDLPVAYRTGSIDVSRSYSAYMKLADYDLLWEHNRAEYMCWVREHDGDRLYGTCEVSLSRLCNGWAKASVSVTQCEWEEPVNG